MILRVEAARSAGYRNWSFAPSDFDALPREETGDFLDMKSDLRSVFYSKCLRLRHPSYIQMPDIHDPRSEPQADSGKSQSQSSLIVNV